MTSKKGSKGKVKAKLKGRVLKSFCPYCGEMVPVRRRGYFMWCKKCGARVD